MGSSSRTTIGGAICLDDCQATTMRPDAADAPSADLPRCCAREETHEGLLSPRLDHQPSADAVRRGKPASTPTSRSSICSPASTTSPRTRTSTRTTSSRCSRTVTSGSPRAPRSSSTSPRSRLARVPEGPKERARINERMDWINTQVCRDFAYGFVYPQIFPFHKRRSDEAQDATLHGARSARRPGSRCSTSTSSARRTHISAATGSRSPTTSARRSSRWGTSCAATSPAIRTCSAGCSGCRRCRTWKKVNETIEGYAASLKEAPLQPI